MRTALNSLHLAVAVLAAAGAAPAHAQCSVYRLNVPDFDQRRDPGPGIDSLPGDGNCYCVPTSVMNWLAYISNNGYPEIANGPRNWQSNTHYEDVTDILQLMGVLMSTSDGVDPNGCGTNATGFTIGTSAILDGTYPGEFVVYAIGPNGADTLTPQELYAQEAFGGLVAMSYSRWTFLPPNPSLGLPARYLRQPVGHCISLTRVTDACGASPRVWYRDPAGFDGDDTDQSQFVTQLSDLTPIPFFYTGTVNGPPVFRTMWQFADIESSVSMLDSAWVITPVHGLWADPVLGEVSIAGMWNFDDLTISPPTTHQLPGTTAVLDILQSPVPGRAVAIARNSAGARGVYTVTFGGSLNPPTVQHVFALNDPGPMALDRTSRLHVVDGQILRRLDTSTSPASVLQTRSLIAEPADVAVSDRDRSVVVLFATIPGGAAAHMESHDDTSYPDDYMDEPLPPWCPVDPDSSLAIAPGGAIYIATPSTNSIYRLSPVPGGGFTGYAITHSSIVSPHNLHCTHDERLVFTSDVGTERVVRALRLAAELGQWVPDTAAALVGQTLPRNSAFSLSISRTYDDDLIDTTLIENIEDIDDGAPGVPDCFADFNADGVVTVPDIFAFLAAWFASDLTADVNFDDVVAVPDIFAFLAAWFAGC